MLYLHTILILLAVILPVRRCDGSLLFRPVSYRKYNIRKYVSINKRRVKKNVAFMVNVVPRGGGSDIDYFGIDDEEVTDSSEYSDEEPIDPILNLPLSGLEPSKFSFLSNIHIMHYAHVLIRVTKRACIAGVRAVMMNENNKISGDIEEEEDSSRPVVNTILGKGAYVIGQMYHAALTPPEDDDCIDELDIVKNEEGTQKRRRKRRKQPHTDDHQQSHRHRHRMKKRKKQVYTSSPTAIPSCGGIEEDEGPSHDAAILQLAKQYNINFLSNKPLSKRYTSILLSSQITLNEALQKANTDARFLICYISKGGSSNTNNALIMPNLLSSEVVKMINRKPLGKKQTGDTASYYIWITNDDKDVDFAMKRLKLKPPTSRNNSSSKKKSKKSSTAPILTIIYPSTAIDPSSGGNKLTVSPKIVTQHHCHPPPSTSETLISWMNTIRKRHLREYNKLQFDRKEFQLLKERTEGYVKSQQQDKAREEKDEMMKQKKKKEEEMEKARIQQILHRRKELLDNLVEEPDMGEDGVITIALRFSDGVKRDMSTCKRRFNASTTTTNDVFNWIDAVHEMEREKVELSTMNGTKKFIYDEDLGEEQTLKGAGLGKMTALRVSEIVVVGDDAKEDETGEEEEEESVEEDESEEYDEESDEYDSDEE